MGRDTRSRSLSSDSARSGYSRRNYDKRDKRSRCRRSRSEERERTRSDLRSVIRSKCETRKSRENESHPYSRSRTNSHNRNYDENERHFQVRENSSGLSERLDRLECMLQCYMKRTEKSQNDRPVRYSVKADCIPEFEPGKPNLSAQKWVEKIDQLASINDWDDKTIIYHMQSRLAGLAKEWYTNLSTYNLSWVEWKALIIKSFPEHHDFAESLRRVVFRTKREDESMTEYYFGKMSLLQACRISGKDAVSCIIDGIKDPTIQTGARAGRYDKPEDLYSEFLSSIPLTNKFQTKSANRDENKMFKRTKIYEGENKKKFKYAHQERERIFSSVKCFNCNEKGHTANKCGKPKLECKSCNKLGHATNDCYKKSANTVKYTTHDATKNSEMYFIECKINDTNICGYIDTGCSGVLIKEKSAQDLNLDIKPCNLVVNGYAGGSTKVIGEVNIKLKVDLAEVVLDALVVPNCIQSVPVLIGQSFLNNNDITVVITNKKIRVFKNEEVELPQIESLPPAKVALWAKEAQVIPANSVGYIQVVGDINKSVYVELRHVPVPNADYWIPRCVTNAKDGFLSVLNISNAPITFKRNQVIARGIPCEEDQEELSVSTLISKINKLKPFVMKEIENQIDEQLNEGNKRRLLSLINQYRHCFAQNLRELGKTEAYKMNIILSDDKPVTYKAYRMSHSEREVVRNIVDELKESSIIRDSTSPFSSPILLVKKKNGEFRMCVDYRKLNSVTVKDRYPLPRIDDQLERLNGCQFFTSLDLASGYHQIPIDEESIEKTAFITPDGHYEYLRMPFGLANAPAVFQRTINAALGNLRFNTVLAYMDDLLIPSTNIDKGFQALEKVFKCLSKANLTLRLEKCFFFKTKIEYLGYEVTLQGIQPGKRKILAISEFQKPINVHQLRQFLGLSSYFRKFVKGFATIASPLTRLLKKDSKFIWTEEQQYAFNELKQKLIERPVLALYNHEAEIELHTDASKVGIGGILLQKQPDGNLNPVSYYSRSTTEEERRYHSYELETLAVVDSLKHFRVYLTAKTFKVVTDCSAVRSAFIKRDLVPRIGRWWLTVLDFNFTVEYRPGPMMGHVDALSRNPLPLPTEESALTINLTNDDWVLAAQLADDQCKRLIDILSVKPTSTYEKEVHKEYALKKSRWITLGRTEGFT